MKDISEYQYPVVITSQYFPSRYTNILRIEISHSEILRRGEPYPALFRYFLEKFRRLNFSVSESSSFDNQTDHYNVMEFSLSPCVKVEELAKDVEEELDKMFESVLNRVTIKKELRK